MSPRHLNVLMIGDRLDQRGGIATLQRMQLQNAPEYIHTTHVATHDEGSHLFRIGFFLRAWLRTIWLLRTQPFDVVHIHQSGGGSLIRKSLIASASQRRGVPIVLHGHAGHSDSTLSTFPRPVRRRISHVLGRSNIVVALSQGWADWYHETIGIPHARLRVVHNPAPGRRHDHIASTRDGQQPLRIVSVSRLREDKGTFDLVRAFAEIAPELRGDAELVLVGDGDQAEIRLLASELGISSQVHLTGWLEGEELGSAVRAADIFVSPSHHEGIPLALLEAMAEGLAPISTSVGGIPEVIEHGRSGLLVPIRRVDLLAGAITQLLTDDSLRIEIAGTAAAMAEMNSVGRYWQRIEGAYRAAIDDTPTRGVSDEPKQISVVVPTFNRAPWLVDALDSLARLRTDDLFEYEIVVVDNASEDTTRAVVAEAAKKFDVRIRYCYESLQGDGAARNHGIGEAEYDWLAFFDDDQRAAQHWLLELRRTAVSSGARVIGGAVLLDEAVPLERFGPVVRRDMLREDRPYSHARPYDPKVLPGTGNFLVAREVFDSVGLFDEEMDGGSDYDFLRRSRDAAFEAWHAPDAIVYHRVGSYRRTHGYFRRESRRNGWSLADETLQARGRLALVGECTARIGQAALVNAPHLVYSKVRRDDADATDRLVLLWRAEGFLRRTADRFFPRAWPQDDFLETHRFAGHESQQVIAEES